MFVFDNPDSSSTPVRCSQGMFASEVFLHIWLLNSECRTMDPEKADFFFVPFYSACIQMKDNKYSTEMDQQYIDFLRRDDVKHYLHRD